MTDDRTTTRRGRTTLTAAARAERDAQVLALALEGLTVRQIGAQTGLSKTQAAHIVNTQLTAMAEAREQNAAEAIALEASRCDALQAALWPDAMNRDVKAVNAIVRVMERRAKLLGLDAREGVELAYDGAPFIVEIAPGILPGPMVEPEHQGDEAC